MYLNSVLVCQVYGSDSVTVVVIVDIKPANMEELTEVITASEFHPSHCNQFAYSSSKGCVRLCDMRSRALCDTHSKCKYSTNYLWLSMCTFGVVALLYATLI